MLHVMSQSEPNKRGRVLPVRTASILTVFHLVSLLRTLQHLNNPLILYSTPLVLGNKIHPTASLLLCEIIVAQ